MRGNVIAAISTPPGKGGVAVIRMSGDGAIDIARRVFEPAASKKSLDDYAPRTQIYGYIIYNEERIDDVMLTVFPSPRSYTGEDVVEISCHGGALITKYVLEALLVAGATPAEAGEFTRRAFLNGKLSLSEAEAIGTLLEAASREQIRLSTSPARTRLAARIDDIRKDMTDVMSSIYARIDYPDEDLGEFTDEQTVERLKATRAALTRLIDTYRTGRAITEGVKTVICGKPNVGKSTIYNLLLGEEEAIVTDIAGTTRDVLHSNIPLGRVILRLYDTAGIRSGESIDTVESIGIERSREQIGEADLVLAVFDLSRPFDSYDRELINELQKTNAARVCILNKVDAVSGGGAFDKEELDEDLFDETVTTSAASDEESVVERLSEIINRLFTDEKISTSSDAIISSARQHSTLLRARDFIDTAIGAYEIGLPADAASSDVEMALGAISEIDGRAVSEGVVADIFSKFCVGK